MLSAQAGKHLMKVVGSRNFPGSLVVKVCASHVGGYGFDPGRGTKIHTCHVAPENFFFFLKVFVGRRKEMLRAEKRAEGLSAKLGVRMWNMQKIKYQNTNN